MNKTIIHCLIVDDEENIVDTIKKSLSTFSYEKKYYIEYHTANNAYSAIKIMKEKNISIFILDYNLEGGENATIIIDNINHIDEKLIYLISGEESVDLEPIINEYSKIEWLPKPLRHVELLSIHQKIINFSTNLLDDKISTYYKKQLKIFSESQKSLEKDIENLLSSCLNIIKIESRIKEYNSFYKKLVEHDYNTNSIKDLFGLRIICYYISDIDIITKKLYAELNVNIITEKIEENSFGYRSTHLIVSMKNNWCEIPRYKHMKNIVFEIQIRTVVMHAWAAISHNLFYKKDNDSEYLNRKLNRLSALLEEVDMSFNEMTENSE